MIETVFWRSADELRRNAAEWNHLWSRAQSRVALHRAEPLAAWLDNFAAANEVAVLALRQDGQLLAGLPLVIQNNRWGQRIGVSSANEWAPQACWLSSGPSLSGEAIARLREALSMLRLFQLKLDWCPLNWPRAEQFVQDWNSAGQAVWIRPRYEVSQLEMAENWSVFRSQWSRNRRKKVQQMERELARCGTVEFIAHETMTADEATQLLALAIRIEQDSWKGTAGGALGLHSAALTFYQSWFRQLAADGLARVYLLQLDGQPIAFDLGYVAQGVYSSIKISYVSEYQHLRPGEWLNVRLLEHFHQNQQVHLIDCIGPVSEATARWETSRYTVGKLVLATPAWFSGLSVTACQQVAQWLGKNALPST